VKEIAVWRIPNQVRSPPDDEFIAFAMSGPEYAAFNEPRAADIRVFNKAGDPDRRTTRAKLRA
jgi:hypothetical protein